MFNTRGRTKQAAVFALATSGAPLHVSAAVLRLTLTPVSRTGARSLPVHVHDPVWLVRGVPLCQDWCVWRSPPSCRLGPRRLTWRFLSTPLLAGSVLPPLFAHIFCNSMGLPQPASACARHPYKKLETGIAYAVGVVGFVLGLKYC